MIIMKGISRMTLNVDMGSTTVMNSNLKVILKMINLMEMEQSNGPMEISTEDYFKITTFMGMGVLNGEMEGNTRGNTITI